MVNLATVIAPLSYLPIERNRVELELVRGNTAGKTDLMPSLMTVYYDNKLPVRRRHFYRTKQPATILEACSNRDALVAYQQVSVNFR
jgi:hypothetical protein